MKCGGGHDFSRAARRRADREITKLIKRDGDRCSLCHAALTHNCKTFGGVTASGAVAITGECCASKLAFVLGAGFYLDRNHRYDFLRSRGSGEACPDEAAAAAIDRYREGIAAADRWTADILKRSGTPRAPRVLMSLFDSPWKDNDKAWFEENPGRSHRLRPLFPGEIDSSLLPGEAPPGHTWEIVVRQRVAPETIEKHSIEQSLRDATYALDLQLHDLRSEFLHRESKLRQDYLDRVAAITSGE